VSEREQDLLRPVSSIAVRVLWLLRLWLLLSLLWLLRLIGFK
jgi:hypothetical protein